MKRIAILVTLCALPTWASPPVDPAKNTAAATATAAVQAELVRPLAAREARRSRFSRAAPVATARRVRIVDETTLTDQTGATFVRFAVDVRRGFLADDKEEGAWNRDTESGCVYLESHQVFVRRADRHYPVVLLLAKKAEPAPPHVCQSQPQATARR